MRKEPLVLDVARLDIPEPPTLSGAKVELHGAEFEVVTATLTPTRLMELAVLTDQLALDIEAARMLAKVPALARAGSAIEASAPAVLPVHIAHDFDVVLMPDGGLLFDVKAAQGKNFRLSVSPEQAAHALLGVWPSASRRRQ